MALFGDSLALRVMSARDAASADSIETGATRTSAQAAAIIRADGLRCLTSRQPTIPAIDVVCDTSVSRAGLRVHPAAATTARAALPDATSRVELWHASLERFGAEQLNQRFMRRFGVAMDSDAWAGWIAMKIVSECALRAEDTSPIALRRALADPKAHFDGHKGRPLSFDPHDGALIQPLYVVARDSAGVERVTRELMPGGS